MPLFVHKAAINDFIELVWHGSWLH